MISLRICTQYVLSNRQEAILKAVTGKTGSGSSEGGGSGSAFNTNGADSMNNRSLRIGKIDFPMFSGDDVEGWVYHCEHFFAMDETPKGMKLRYAVVHLEGDALQWHRAYLRTRNAIVAEIQWDEYVRSISGRFSNAMFEDPLEELASLNQTGTLHDLNTAFDALLNKVNLTESQAISLYLKALSSDIKGMVNMFRPRTLHEAYGLAKTQALNNESLEEKINKDKGNSENTRNYSNFNITPPVNASKLPLLPTPKPAKITFTKPNGGPRHLTSKELEYKRAKGECNWCTEKFVPVLKCPRNQVYVIKMEDDDDKETEEIGAETEEKEHQISIHALTGLPSYSTMRVQGSVGFVSFTSFPALGTSFVTCELFSVVFACLLSCVSCWCSGYVVSFNPGPVVLLWCCWVVVPQVVFACGSLELFAGLWFCYISEAVISDNIIGSVVPWFRGCGYRIGDIGIMVSQALWLLVCNCYCFVCLLASARLFNTVGSGFRVVAQVWCLLRLFASDVVLGLAHWLLLQRPCWIAIVLRYQFCLLVLMFFGIRFCLFGFSLDCKFGCLFGVVVFAQVCTSCALYPSMAILRFHCPFSGLNECHDSGGNEITKAYLITYLRDRHCNGYHKRTKSKQNRTKPSTKQKA
nr:hypothetical protein [Tanacetum cinerariifolium]